MFKQLSSPANQLPLAVSIALLAGNLLLLLVLYYQLISIADANQAKAGKSLAYQLAYNVKTPMLHQDALSLQVGVGDIAKQPGVAGAGVYDNSQRLLVEKSNGQQAIYSVTQYREPIEIENAVAGYAVVDVENGFYRQQSILLFRVVLLLVLLTTLAAIAVAWRFNNAITQRIRTLIYQLPELEDKQALPLGNELEQLQQRIAPLLTRETSEKKPADQHSDQQGSCTLVALECRSFERLREQLSGDHFEELLVDLDRLVAKLLTIYKGTLISFFENTLVLQFDGEEDEGHPVRGLYTTFALIKQLEKWQADKGVELEFGAALITENLESSRYHLLEQVAVEKRLNALTRLRTSVSAGSILLDNATASHSMLDDIALLEPVSADMNQFRCEGLQPTADTLVVRQLALLV